ncbi:Trimethyllysine dioxygenase [Pseudovirgaria hyperparasitica]|uniref:Trimethyllysine dioxygenase n=1 Tax=Pseudovirgaria hyperparasitica TaxID=470096 RepID=A0A6A6WF39_9PEZI|nr:Trimethyllysine dioxygenase [Pseudovirgaria hyperparasitica]KAF2761155.1 Trimethyllysine dioxygenase [Pseudovirgaria hyperparasitica]
MRPYRHLATKLCAGSHGASIVVCRHNANRGAIPRHGSDLRPRVCMSSLVAVNTSRRLHTESIHSNKGSLSHFEIRTDGTHPAIFSSPSQGNSAALEAIPPIWLRDNCQCSSCVHQDTKQRNFDTFELPPNLSFQKVEEAQNGYQVQWSDGHESFYEKDWLARAGLKETSAIQQGRAPNPVLWNTDYLAKEGAPSVQYDAVMDPTSEEGVREWVTAIRNFGFCYVEGAPVDPGKTQELLERIAFIRETHYGGFYDFTADLASKDTAYTSIALPAHNDNTYFSDPSGLQMFHLLSHTEGEGGASLLVDGFSAAKELKETDPEAYKILSEVPVQFHASGNEGISIQPYQAFPVFLLDPVDKELIQVRWNESDRAALQIHPAGSQKWYNAAKKFDTLLKSAKYEYWEQLKPGRPLIFDNWRIMHGRSAFTGKRRICGGYITRDDYISRFKMLYYGPEHVLKNIHVGA